MSYLHKIAQIKISYSTQSYSILERGNIISINKNVSFEQDNYVSEKKDFYEKRVGD